MEPRISSITFGVADLEQSCRFYKEGLGFPTSGTPAAAPRQPHVRVHLYEFHISKPMSEMQTRCDSV